MSKSIIRNIGYSLSLYFREFDHKSPYLSVYKEKYKKTNLQSRLEFPTQLLLVSICPNTLLTKMVPKEYLSKTLCKGIKEIKEIEDTAHKISCDLTNIKDYNDLINIKARIDNAKTCDEYSDIVRKVLFMSYSSFYKDIR